MSSMREALLLASVGVIVAVMMGVLTFLFPSTEQGEPNNARLLQRDVRVGRGR